MYEIIKSKTYQKAEKLYRNVIGEKRIADMETALASNPKGGNRITFIEGTENRYRYRIGDFRILYTVFDDEVEILMIDIRPRGDAYKK